MPQRRIIIGDVHGHYGALMTLLEAIAPAKDDYIYFLGDLIDRGPDSAKVVDFVYQNEYPCLLGNHEQMLLDTIASDKVSSNLLQSWVYSGGYTTLLSYDHKIPPEHIEWMQNLPLYVDLGNVWLVHAGVDPNQPIEKQDTEEFCWIRDDFHQCQTPYFPDKTIITGHTITFTFPGVQPGQLAAGAGWLDIDTGAYHPHSGWLTGLDITQQKVYQAHAKTGKKRTIALEKAVAKVDPKMVAQKRSRRRTSAT
ncbi:MAG: metallophosphoesterase family protein [Microcystaceae cyanobacterium]